MTRRLFSIVLLILFSATSGLILYEIARLLNSKNQFEQFQKEIKEYENIPYFKRELAIIEAEYRRIIETREKYKNSAIVIAEIVDIMKKNNLTITSLLNKSKEAETELKEEVYEINIIGEFKNIFYSIAQINGQDMPVNIIEIKLFSFENDTIKCNILLSVESHEH